MEQKLSTPAVTMTHTNLPNSEESADGTVTVSWPDVDDAVSYTALIAYVGSPTVEDFIVYLTNVSSPFTFTGLNPGLYGFGIRAEAE